MNMTIDKQIEALNQLIAKEKRQLVQREATQFSEKYVTLLTERDRLTTLRETNGGAFETVLSVHLETVKTPSFIYSRPIRPLSSDSTSKDPRRAHALSFLAAAKQESSTDDSQRAARSISH